MPEEISNQLLLFDIVKIYIINMGIKININIDNDIECDIESVVKDDCKMPSSKRNIVILCVLIPFFLFMAGVSSPFWTDNYIVYALCLLPFYTYMVVISTFVNPEWCLDYVSEKKFYAAQSCFVGMSIPTAISILGGFFGFTDYDALYHGTCVILAFNIPASIVFTFLFGYECSRLYEVKKVQKKIFSICSIRTHRDKS